MKKSIFLFTVLFLISCNSFVDDSIDLIVEEDFVDVIEEEEIELLDLSEVKDYELTASSVLVDNTTVGFLYDETMLLDNDFSTAWCSKEGGVDGEIVFTFEDNLKVSTLGIVPGFARDDIIYFQNNRIKELQVIYLNDEEVLNEEIFELNDEYTMHFVDLNFENFNVIKFVIKEVYPGAKYDDTCLSEIEIGRASCRERV